MDFEQEYMIDIDNVIKYCFDDGNSKSNDSEITEVYVNDENTNQLVLTSKQLREVKSSDSSSVQTIKYDLVKTLLTFLFDINYENITYGDGVIINTLINKGFLKEIK